MDKWHQKKKHPLGEVKKYNKIENVVDPTFKRVVDKPENKYKLDFIERDKGGPGFNPYEYQINRRIKQEENEDGKEYPKVGWEARAFYEMSLQISKQDPTWESEDKNPIMYYIPSRELPGGVDLPTQKYEPADKYPTQRFENTQGDQFQRTQETLKEDGEENFKEYESEKSLGGLSRDSTETMNNLHQGKLTNQAALETIYKGKRTFTKSHAALADFKRTQLMKGTKRTEVAGLQNPEPEVKQFGFRTRFILNDLFTDKAIDARKAMNKPAQESNHPWAQQKEDHKNQEQYIPNEFEPYKDPVFRDLDLPFGKKELNLLYKCPKAENPYNLSVHNTKPKMVQDKEIKEREELKAKRKEEYEKALQSDKPRPKDLKWNQFLHVPDKLKPISTGLKDYYKPKKIKAGEKKEFLDKDPYGDETPLLAMSRQMRETEVFGKPSLKLYFKPAKATDEDLDVEFGRVSNKFKTIY